VGQKDTYMHYLHIVGWFSFIGKRVEELCNCILINEIKILIVFLVKVGTLVACI